MRQFQNTVYISFYNNRRIAGIFDQDYDTRRIVNAWEIELKQKIEPHKTLLIFDEVQTVPKVVESLKYFCEEARDYAVIAAGSLLGVAIHEGVSFPVGKVDELRLYPMDFEEFLRAMDEDRLADYKKNPSGKEANSFSERYRQLLKEYYFVGGMPEAVDAYRQNRNFDEVREIQRNILSQYEGDFGKHVESRTLPRIRMVWDALPMQLSKENRKFFVGQVKQGARMKDFETAIQWLCDSGLVHKVHKVSKPGFPLKAYADFDSFKIYMLDVGLLAAKSELDKSSIINGNAIFTEFKGALTEQYVLQEFKATSKMTPFYYSSEKSCYEVDFLIQKGNDVVPIEVKAEENLKAKSLKFYCEKFKPAEAVRTSMSNYRKESWMTNIPLWCVQF